MLTLVSVFSVLCIILTNGMIEQSTSHVGYEVRSLHQFKYEYHGTMTLTAKAKFHRGLELSLPRDDINDDDGLQPIDRMEPMEPIDEDNHEIGKRKEKETKIENPNGKKMPKDIGNSIDNIENDKIVSGLKNVRRLMDVDENGNQVIDGGNDNDEIHGNDQLMPLEMPNQPNGILYLYHCTDKELNKLDGYSEMAELCSDISLKYSIENNLNDDASGDLDVSNTFDCSWSDVLTNENPKIEYEFQSTKSRWMTLIGINCSPKSSFTIVTQIAAQNRNGEYLSLSEVPYKPLYLYLSGVWAFVSIFWFIHWWRYSIFNVSIHQLLTFVPILMSISCITWHFYWNYCSLYGKESDNYTLIAYIASGLSDAWIALCLMYISEGWGILRGSFESYYKLFEIYGIFLLVFISDILTNYYTSLLILLVISYVLTLRRVLNGYTKMMRLLNTQHEILASVDYNSAMFDNTHPLNVKLSIYKSFQKCVILFIGCEVVYYWGSSFLIETPWINTILSNSIIFALTVYVGWEFRMRPFRPNFHLFVTSHLDEENNNINNNNIDNNNDENNDEIDYILTEEWRPGDRTPLFPKDYNTWLSSNNREIVVMSNEVDSIQNIGLETNNNNNNNNNRDDDNSSTSSVDLNEKVYKYSIATPIISYANKYNKISPFKDDLSRMSGSRSERRRLIPVSSVNNTNSSISSIRNNYNNSNNISNISGSSGSNSGSNSGSSSNFNSYQNIDMSGLDVTGISNSNRNTVINYEGGGILDNESDDE